MITIDRAHGFRDLQFTNGERMPIHRDLIKHMSTLQNMMSDFATTGPETPIPLPAFITEPIMKWIIDAYILYEAKGFGLESFDNLYDNIAIYNNLNALTRPDASPSYLTLFPDGGEPIRDDLPLMATLIEALSWLEAKQLLLITLDKLFEIVRGMTNGQIRDAYTSQLLLIDISDTNRLPYTPYYEREELIYDFLVHMLPRELIPVISPAIQRYVNPIQCGTHHQLFMKADGLYGAGSDVLGQLGLGTDEVHPLTKLTTLPGNPLLIACSSSSSYCLTTNGLLYHTGSDVVTIGKGRVSQWTLLDVDGKVLLIEGCPGRIMVLTTNGLFAMGNNLHGELGLGDELPRSTLTRVPIDGKVLAISCGDDHTIILTTSGLYGAGSNSHHQLSSVIKGNATNRFQRILTSVHDITSIAAGASHTIIVTSTGVFGTGLAESGQLGRGNVIGGNLASLSPIKNIEGIPISVYANDGYTMLLTSTGLYSTGLGKTGNTQKFVKVFDTSDGEGEGICSVTCSQQQVFIFTDKGNVYLAGRTRGLPTAEVSMEDESDIVLKVFTKMAIEMGYTSTCLEDDKKLTKLQCSHCNGVASFIVKQHDDLALCSKYCLYKHNLQ